MDLTVTLTDDQLEAIACRVAELLAAPAHRTARPHPRTCVQARIGGDSGSPHADRPPARVPAFQEGIVG